MPTSEWNAATSSGIAVIGTLRAMVAPMPPPMTSPPAIRAHVSGSSGAPIWASVVAMAMPMPTMPSRLPRREVSGLDSPRSAMMNSTAAAR